MARRRSSELTDLEVEFDRLLMNIVEYGNPLDVHRTVVELIAAGAAGCFLQDQVWPKRCGYLRGKRVIGRDDYVQKVRAAVAAVDDRDFFIVARTDALAVEGLDEAIARVEAARAAGAHASFVEAPDSLDDLREVARRSPAPNVANMIEGGGMPVLPEDRMAELGLQLILYPPTGLFAAARAIEAMYRRLKADGTTLGDEGSPMSFAEFNELIGWRSATRCPSGSGRFRGSVAPASSLSGGDSAVVSPRRSPGPSQRTRACGAC
jgi:2-methylisocitrate lyase-like PEP mutase family enzyme